MAVTLTQIREKREEVRLLKEKFDQAHKAAFDSWELNRNNEIVKQVALAAHSYAIAELQEIGRQFALDEGEEQITDDMDIPF